MREMSLNARNAFRITGEDASMQKVNYIHMNPARAGLADHTDEYLFSSADSGIGKMRLMLRF